MTRVMFIVFIILLLLGIPIAFVIGISSLVYILREGMPLVLLAQRFYVSVTNYLILSVPMFILAGKLMNESGITRRLVDFFNMILGHIRGGLAYITIVASLFFAGITGAGAADAAAIGAIMIPAMKKEGYSAEYSGAVTAVASIIGPTIPPSIAMVIYGASAGVSIAKLFLGGIIPGILIGIAQLIVAYVYSKKHDVPVKARNISFAGITRGLKDAILALLMPVILLGGILSGIFTPTEAAGVSVLYAVVVGFFVFRELNLKKLFHSLYETALVTATILFILAFAHLFGWILSAEDVPDKVAQVFIHITNNRFLLLLLINILFLIVGTFMETLASVILLTPVLLPLAQSIGLDPVHFGVMMVVALNIGLVTPPLGVCLFVSAPIAGVSVERLVLSCLPFIFASIVVLLLITYIPSLVMFIPNLVVK
ncbi:TRAP dicarboxylate transporter, DctM subunit [Spirochaeta thermophila DSM 6578]|uniref:TRAP dicarboxylate transporter, DctM subunit n=1 Tax=Winmispira thermophila (strain ATCC 700085 / DSM 6578 / Z-1203) TaxID=869211 RepID=G0GBA0_WINT7|nr:TRAP transporter large permease [Spirochaeta thermophila]AEJ61909.1 TRAP dicarboxylate transporter, DctM subunit [Spirochaeta thermophila DSM 6578]